MGYVQAAIGEQASPQDVENCTETYCNMPIKDFLIPSIKWCEEKKDYVAIYKMPRNVHRFK